MLAFYDIIGYTESVRGVQMKKRTGLAIAGGILEIIAGVSWLSYALFGLSVFIKLNYDLKNYDWIQLIYPISFVVFGIMACVGRKKKYLISYGIMNLIFVAWLVYKAVITNTFASFIYSASGEIIMLIVSSCFFFFTKQSEYEQNYNVLEQEYKTEFNKRLSEYKANEPVKTKKNRKIVTFLCCAQATIINLLFLICCHLFLIGEELNLFISTFITTVSLFVVVLFMNKKQTKYRFLRYLYFVFIIPFINYYAYIIVAQQGILIRYIVLSIICVLSVFIVIFGYELMVRRKIKKQMSKEGLLPAQCLQNWDESEEVKRETIDKYKKLLERGELPKEKTNVNVPQVHLPPLPPEIKARMEQNKKEDNMQ